jgi:hypothetical protein
MNFVYGKKSLVFVYFNFAGCFSTYKNSVTSVSVEKKSTDYSIEL